MSGTSSRNTLAGLLAGQGEPPPHPLLERIQRNPVGMNRFEPSMTNQSPAFDPLVGFTGGVPVTQSQAAALPVDPISGRLNPSGEIVANALMGASSGVVPKVARGARALPPIRPSSDNVGEVMDANFQFGRNVGPRMMPVADLSGGVALDAPEQVARVNRLRDAITGEGGYLSRMIVDTDGNVVEGQHRLEALRAMGVKNAPVHVIQDMAAGIDLPAFDTAISKAQQMHSDQRHQLSRMVLESVAEAGSPAKVREMYDPPAGYEAAWNAALDHLTPKPVPAAALDWSSGYKSIPIGNATVEMSVAPSGDYASVSMLKVPPQSRGQGAARNAMQSVVDDAQKNGVTLFLTPDPMERGVSARRLTDFYKSLGFEPNRGRNRDFRSRDSMILPAPEGGQ